MTWPDSPSKPPNSRRLGGLGTGAPPSSRPATVLTQSRVRPRTGQARLPKAEGRGAADRLCFTSSWCFGESLPLKTAGPTAAVSDA